MTDTGSEMQGEEEFPEVRVDFQVNCLCGKMNSLNLLLAFELFVLFSFHLSFWTDLLN